jgi:hypothetical protein
LKLVFNGAPSSKFSLASCSSAKWTKFSEIGVSNLSAANRVIASIVFVPSHNYQIIDDVLLRQSALFIFKS